MPYKTIEARRAWNAANQEKIRYQRRVWDAAQKGLTLEQSIEQSILSMGLRAKAQAAKAEAKQAKQAMQEKRREDKKRDLEVNGRQCYMCKRHKPLGNFCLDPRKSNGRGHRCYTCARDRKRKLIEAAKERFTPTQRKQTMARFGHQCFTCSSREDLVIDHHAPISLGHALSESNAVVLCRSCNLNKGDAHPSVYYSLSEIERLLRLGISTPVQCEE
jgi:5-methylcytosine-specific restriction endonuclease McrA